jgi:hypothetical protein
MRIVSGGAIRVERIQNPMSVFLGTCILESAYAAGTPITIPKPTAVMATRALLKMLLWMPSPVSAKILRKCSNVISVGMKSGVELRIWDRVFSAVVSVQ